MKEEELQDVAKTLPKELPKVSVFAGMPKRLKEPKNFEKIYKIIYEAGNSRCSHSDILEYSVCKKCEGARMKRVEVMRKLGFSSGQQYLAWLRVHQNMRTYHREELEKYNT